MLKSFVWNTFGGGAIKALAGGVGAGGAAAVTMLAGACDIESIGQQIGGIAGAAILGYIVTWLSPKNR